MWSYNFVIPSFMILLILLVYYFSRPHIAIRMNSSFLAVLLSQGFVIILRVIVARLSEVGTAPRALLFTACLLYFIVFLMRGYSFFLFTADVLHIRIPRSKLLSILSWGVFALAEGITLASIVTPTIFYVDASGYHDGPLYFLLYVVSVHYITLSFVLLARFGKRLNHYELLSAYFANFLLLAGIIARFLYPQVMIMNVFCLMSIIIFYLSFMNPDLYGSDRGPTFNQRAFRDMIRENIGVQPYRILCFVLHSYSDEREIYGYAQMDQGITLISQFLKEQFPDYQLFYLRNGCFAVFGPENMDWDAMREIIQKRFQSPWSADEADLFLNVSFVRISSRADTEDTESLMERLFSAFNEAGRKAASDQLIDLDEIHDIDRLVDVKRSLERAVENDEVEIYLQPLIESKTGKMRGAEVLARIRDEQGNIIPPGMFISIAEQNGQINRLGSQVFEKACRFIHDGYLRDTGLSWLNVNLSPIQCMKKDLAEEFGAILKRYEVDAHLIHLEITEASMIDLSLLQKQIQTLRNNGFEFALDDYGSGYSNLTRVKHYPFINIKLDMEVVWDYYKDKDILLPAIVEAFKSLNFSVTAEGIETKEMGECMKEIGCDFLQGYYFSRPLPVNEFLQQYSA